VKRIHDNKIDNKIIKSPRQGNYMKEKKHIDQLFKERFKTFEASPSPQVWDQIQAKLKEEKKDRKVIPLWVKLGGVAALLALILTVGNSVFNPTNATSPITEEKTDVNTWGTQNNSIHNNNDNKKTEVVSEDINFIKDAVENSSSENEVKSDSQLEVLNKNPNNSETKIAYENDPIKVSDKKENNSENIIKDPTNKTSNAIDAVAVTKEKNNSSYLNSNTEKTRNESLINKEKAIPIINDKEAVAENEVIEPKKMDDSSNNTETDKKETVVAANEEENKRSIFDEIEEKNEEEAIAIIDNSPDNRWDVTPYIAPVYYNSISDGSSIDPSFSDNPKSGDLNMAYGVNVGYHLNNRLSVHSGLSNVNLSYSITGIELGNGPVAVALKSVDYNKRENVVIAVDKGSLANQNTDGEFGTITPKSTSGEPSLNQKISYYEVPLELKYALINKKFGVNLIGGFSTLFLGENEIYVDSGDFNETLGEANNLSTLSFTTNIGLGLNYSFSKKLMFNIEPMFKYQLNPYTESTVDFKPYYVGIYTGLSFKF